MTVYQNGTKMSKKQNKIPKIIAPRGKTGPSPPLNMALSWKLHCQGRSYTFFYKVAGVTQNSPIEQKKKKKSSTSPALPNAAQGRSLGLKNPV